MAFKLILLILQTLDSSLFLKYTNSLYTICLEAVLLLAVKGWAGMHQSLMRWTVSLSPLWRVDYSCWLFCCSVYSSPILSCIQWHGHPTTVCVPKGSHLAVSYWGFLSSCQWIWIYSSQGQKSFSNSRVVIQTVHLTS